MTMLTVSQEQRLHTNRTQSRKDTEIGPLLPVKRDAAEQHQNAQAGPRRRSAILLFRAKVRPEIGITW